MGEKKNKGRENNISQKRNRVFFLTFEIKYKQSTNADALCRFALMTPPKNRLASSNTKRIHNLYLTAYPQIKKEKKETLVWISLCPPCTQTLNRFQTRIKGCLSLSTCLFFQVKVKPWTHHFRSSRIIDRFFFFFFLPFFWSFLKATRWLIEPLYRALHQM